MRFSRLPASMLALESTSPKSRSVKPTVSVLLGRVDSVGWIPVQNTSSVLAGLDDFGVISISPARRRPEEQPSGSPKKVHVEDDVIAWHPQPD